MRLCVRIERLYDCLHDKLTETNKYCNTWNGTKPWVAELASFFFFWSLFWIIMGPASFFAIRFEFGDQRFLVFFLFKKKKTYLSCWVSFLSPPPPLPGWRSQPNSAVGSWHRQVFRHLAGWQAPRLLCWPFPSSLSCAGAEDIPLGTPCCGDVAGHGGGPVLSCSTGLWPSAKPSSSQQWSVHAVVAFCQCLCFLLKSQSDL